MFRNISDARTDLGQGERAILVCQLSRSLSPKLTGHPPPSLAHSVNGKRLYFDESDLVESNPDSPLRELGELAKSAGAEICAEFIAVRHKPVAATFIGKGKAEELGELVSKNDATLVIFDHNISPMQERNIERIVQCRVLDRSGLILDIFAQRATSSEGKLQVELAQLKHLSTRLVRGWTHLERQKGGIGLRGPGESQLETDRRLIGMRIKTLDRRLDKVESQRSLRRRARHRTPIPTVSLVGYTNTGKSSLFNALTGSKVLVEDRLFATLDPTMRRVELPGFGPIVLSDTVGFVRELPHTLVAAFHSTLEEVASATCLLLVSDASDPDHRELRNHVELVLDEIGANEIPVIHIYNKIDLTGDQVHTGFNAENRVDKIWLSATTGAGVELVSQALAEHLSKEHQDLLIRLKPQAGELRSRLFQRCEVVSEEVDEAGNIVMKLNLDAKVRGWLESQHQFDGLWDEISSEN